MHDDLELHVDRSRFRVSLSVVAVLSLRSVMALSLMLGKAVARAACFSQIDWRSDLNAARSLR